MIGLCSYKLSRLPQLAVFLDAEPRWLPLGHTNDVEAFAGWGRKRKARAAQRRAARKGLPFLVLEDGFLRSVERNDPPLSLVVDDLGIYYDASQPSRLEKLIALPLDDAQKSRARTIIPAWRQGRVSKYNGAREYEGPLPSRFVLVCDQTFGDASVRYGQADKACFARMLEAALAENPDCTVLVKTHPDVFTRGKRGYFDPNELKSTARVVVIAQDSHPVRLIAEAEAVYTVTSQMGFEALLWGKRVRVFGMPFYAGWGLTDDDLPTPERRHAVSLEQLLHAALIGYPRYVDPETGVGCEVERVLSHIALQRKMRLRFSAHIHAAGFSRWKRPILKRFLSGSAVRFAQGAGPVPSTTTVAVWGRRGTADLPADTQSICVEDGFLRSVGLGADLTRPVSWVCDDVGLYYDATRPSRLELILSDTAFDEPLLARAQSLRQAILNAGLTKYNLGANVGSGIWQRPLEERRVVLVPGQVEDDASIRYGAPGINTNLGLLRAVRHANPDAHIVYKPHPDVVAGLRASGEGEGDVADFCDEVVIHADIAHLLQAVDEVATLTSLAGFEALMRGKAVTCYGQPFYAGWGLTRDMVHVARRNRRLTLDQLIAGALILYPTYVSRLTNRFTTPERAVEELTAWRAAGKGDLSLWQRILRPAFRFWKLSPLSRVSVRKNYADAASDRASLDRAA